jgi:hypothetical protein
MSEQTEHTARPLTPAQPPPAPYMNRVLDDRFSESEWEKKMPHIAWRDPARLEGEDGAKGLGCRFCILRHGIHGSRIRDLPQTLAEHQAHMQQYHPKP